YVCHRYTSPFCINECNAISKIQYCDYKTGNRFCINGAKDVFCERNGILFKLIIVTLFCDEDICNRNGICQIISNHIKCKCYEGYNGKYCKNTICQNNCNGNGYCINKKACSCNSIYRGKLCNEYPCSKNIINPCVNAGICYQTNNSIKCYCPFGDITGKFCQTLSCGKKCINGKCIFSIKDKALKCICSGSWSGSACGILDVDHATIGFYILMVEFNVLLLFLDITFIILISCIYRKLNAAYNIGRPNIYRIPIN
ncbi:hypothetical protein HZS_7046, partial [Henneguya salminicola]